MEKTGNTNNKRKHKKMAKSQKGITLVALVITIIIIIILATVAINFALSDNGLIRTAEQASDFYANDTKYTDDSITNVESYIDGIMPEEPFTPQPTPEPEQGETELADMTNGVIEIKWLSGTSNYVSETPNAPEIKEDLPDGTTMELVRYTGEESTEQERWVAGTEYSYVAGAGSSDNTSSKWANARVTIDGIDSYFVWIPRYAYRIIYFDTAESKIAYQEGNLTEEAAVASGQIIGYSDSRGIVDAEGKKVANAASTTKIMVSEDYFMTHPAFMNGTETGFKNGEWDSELSGLWIGKYEASLVNKADGTNIVPGSSTNGDILLSDPEHTDKTVATKPGYNSWSYIRIDKIYDNAKYYSTELNSHMLKNSEWGAVAYLTESKYGRNGTEINQNTLYYTGGGRGSLYEENTLQSSTGNVYGIYDLSGCHYEYVAGCCDDIDTIGGNNEYATAYENTDSNQASQYYKYGDATYETSGWHLDYTSFVNSETKFFIRGGYIYNNTDYSGVFFSRGEYYGTYANDSFRLALCVE